MDLTTDGAGPGRVTGINRNKGETLHLYECHMERLTHPHLNADVVGRFVVRCAAQSIGLLFGWLQFDLGNQLHGTSVPCVHQ